MAHSPRAKAQALAMLILGESVTATAAATGIPKQTISRWRKNDLQTYLRPIVQSSPALHQAAQAVAWLSKMGLKKGIF